MKLNYELLHRDIIKKLNFLNLSQRKGAIKIGVSRSTINRILNKKPLHLQTYLLVTDWLEKDLENYIIRRKRAGYIEKRIRYLGVLKDDYVLHDWSRNAKR